MKKTFPLLVYLKRDTKRQPAPAKFEESIVNALRNAKNSEPDCENEIHVDCDISQQALILASSSDQGTKSVILRRPPYCPIASLTNKCLENLPEEIKSRGVAVGVSILLESIDNSILLTRRAKTMRTFPHVWVPPGGHVEHGEGLIEAGMRELEEEIGIKVTENKSTSILGLWESSYPVTRRFGLPKRHHIVVYVHHKTTETAADISKRIHLEKEEVDACTWICSCVASTIVSTDEQYVKSRLTSDERCHSLAKMCIKESEFIDGIIVENDKQLVGRVIPTAPLFTDVGELKDSERVSTGTKFAIKLWLEYLNGKKS